MSNRIERTVQLRAPVERVWQALTDHREFGDWFRVRLDGPFALGEPSTGWMTYPGYEHLPWLARIIAMERPRLFAYEWPPFSDAPAVDCSGQPWTRVEFRLEPAEGGTRLSVVESGFDALSEPCRGQALRSNEGGWTAQMENIQAHVER